MFGWLIAWALGKSGKVPSIPLDGFPPMPPVKKPRACMPRPITGRELVERFQKAGILPDNCKRMVIDASANKFVEIYYECEGDKRLIDVCIPDHLLNLRVKKNDKGTESDGAEDTDIQTERAQAGGI